ncbi:phosphotransferase enzyme family protein [Cytobacillus sp. Hm23]
MEKEIKDLINQKVVNLGATKFGVTIQALTFIGTSQNIIYGYQKNGFSYILRFTPSLHRNEDLVKGELDWILFLANNGVLVSKPIRSQTGSLTEIIEINEDVYLTVTSFIRAEGRKMGYPECLNDHHLYQELGKITGKIHKLSKKYILPRENIKRHEWSNNYYLQNMKQFIPLEQTLVYDQSIQLINKINNVLIKDNDSYGLIHGDINVNNFLVNENGITLFDFDEAQYSWFVEDVAITLYYFVYVHGGEEGKEKRILQARHFMEYYLKGYQEYNLIEDYWLNQIPLFLQLREVIAYVGMYKHCDVTQLNQWGMDYLSQSRIRIETGMSIVDIWG